MQQVVAKTTYLDNGQVDFIREPRRLGSLRIPLVYLSGIAIGSPDGPQTDVMKILAC